MKNLSKPSITVKRQNKTKYQTRNSIRLKFVKKTGISNPDKSHGYIKWYCLSGPRPIKGPSNFIWYNCQKICSWSRKPKTMHTCFISNAFKSNNRLKLAKNQAKAKQHPEAELLLSETYLLCSSILSSKNNRRYF